MGKGGAAKEKDDHPKLRQAPGAIVGWFALYRATMRAARRAGLAGALVANGKH
ncbi:hypothetical protein SF06_04700 [Pseudomonas flexibilis]|nr:hypothetical protein SF06_04700 [Pseudomonas flexibilis]